MKVLAFGITKDIIGKSQMDLVEFAGKTVGELREFLVNEYNEFNQLNSLAIAVNEEYAEDHTTLNDSDVVALIPPVSGG